MKNLMSAWGARSFGILAGAGACLAAARLGAEPLRLRGDAVTEARAPAGLVVLQGSDKERPWLDAEALVWAGARSDSAESELGGVRARSTADVLVLTLRLREPHGLGELRGGRFVFAAGAIRPVQIDGAAALVRVPGNLTVQAVGGSPVLPQSGPRRDDWMAGARVAQMPAPRITLGVSYFRHLAKGELAAEEVGADFATVPVRWLDLAGKGAYDLIGRGVAEASASAAVRVLPWRIELFGSHRSPARLLPATSLFSVLGDFPAQVAGVTVRWDAAPRLDLLATGAGQTVGGDLGGYVTLRGTLRTSDRGDGRLGLELRRQDVSVARWSGVRLTAIEPIGLGIAASTELELASIEQTTGGAVTRPWGLFALSWRSASGWEAAGAVEAASTAQHRLETNALVRVARVLEVP